ncbi:MAG TPA: hypothetical protein VEP90_29515 [Methylomirabilota bacterium]|nr:hypothetical protein [Methylomirabilota bacterium]
MGRKVIGILLIVLGVLMVIIGVSSGVSSGVSNSQMKGSQTPTISWLLCTPGPLFECDPLQAVDDSTGNIFTVKITNNTSDPITWTTTNPVPITAIVSGSVPNTGTIKGGDTITLTAVLKSNCFTTSYPTIDGTLVTFPNVYCAST